MRRAEDASPGRPTAREEAKRPILKAAAEAFMLHGYASASMDDIADNLGASKGRIYHYYRSKADVLAEIHLWTIELYYSTIHPISQKALPAKDRLPLMAYEHTLLILNDVALASVTLFDTTTQWYSTSKQREVRREIVRLRREYEMMFRSVIDEAIRDGDFRPVDSHLVTKSLVGALNWTAAWYKPGADSQHTKEQIAHELSRYAVTGLLAGNLNS